MAPNYESEEVDSSEEESEEEEVAVEKKKRRTKAWKVRRLGSKPGNKCLIAVFAIAKPLNVFFALSTLILQDPGKPKRAMSAFFLYSQGNRSRIKEENPEASFGEIVSSPTVK